MSKKTRAASGVAIILLGLLYPRIKGYVPDIPSIISSEQSVVKTLNIERPSDELIASSQPLKEIITEEKDQEKVSIFAHEFSKRIPNYNAKGQQVVNVLTDAGKDVFGTYLDERYDSKVGDFLRGRFGETVGQYDSVVNDEKKKKLEEEYNSHSWVLGGKDGE